MEYLLLITRHLLVFDGATNVLYTEVQLSTSDSVDVPNFVNNDCFTAPVNICYREARYTFNVTLPPNPNGYIIAYQRCCRNNSISNIVNPQSAGATYLATIPSSAFTSNNSNPVYTNFSAYIYLPGLSIGVRSFSYRY